MTSVTVNRTSIEVDHSGRRSLSLDVGIVPMVRFLCTEELEKLGYLLLCTGFFSRFP